MSTFTFYDKLQWLIAAGLVAVAVYVGWLAWAAHVVLGRLGL